jgi:hypothetical protein
MSGRSGEGKTLDPTQTRIPTPRPSTVASRHANRAIALILIKRLKQTARDFSLLLIIASFEQNTTRSALPPSQIFGKVDVLSQSGTLMKSGE